MFWTFSRLTRNSVAHVGWNEFTLQKLRKDGVEVILNTRLVGAERDKVTLAMVSLSHVIP